MILKDLLSTLICPYWISLQDEKSNEIMRIVKSDSDYLSEYLDKSVYKWWPQRHKALIFVLLKGVYRE